MSDLYALFGSPLRHSLSPRIHSAFAQATGQALRYITIESGAADFGDDLKRFFEQGGKGANLTVPLKELALELVDELGPSARSAGAINTIIRLNSGRTRGENTDGIGFIRDLSEVRGYRASKARILILGAGGAVRGVLPTLFRFGPSAIVVANRSLERAQALVAHFASFDLSHSLRAVALSEAAALEPFDLIINATPKEGVSLLRLSAQWITPQTCCYDLNYGGRAQAFTEFARSAGAERVYDGIGMLIQQAAEAFYLWRGVRPETNALYRELH